MQTDGALCAHIQFFSRSISYDNTFRALVKTSKRTMHFYQLGAFVPTQQSYNRRVAGLYYNCVHSLVFVAIFEMESALNVNRLI
jgi:hypothetical protein